MPPPKVIARQLPDHGLDRQAHAFDLTWQAPNGQSFSGGFVHTCPTVGQTIGIEAAVAKRLAGQVVGDGTREMAFMVEHLQATLAQRPDWATKVEDIPHVQLLTAVAEEAAAHVGRFCGAGDGAGPGAGVAG